MAVYYEYLMHRTEAEYVEEVFSFQCFFHNLDDIRKDIRSLKTHSNIIMDRHCLMVTNQDFLEIEASLWLILLVEVF